MRSVNAACRAALEELMRQGQLGELSDLEEKWLHQGEQRGRQRGREEGRAEALSGAVLKVLEARGLGPSEEMRARVLACRDATLLDLWLARAVTARTLDEVFQPH
ncbi:MAG: hypothetical protein AB2A00_26925 [Myxococcota bacterium]